MPLLGAVTEYRNAIVTANEAEARLGSWNNAVHNVCFHFKAHSGKGVESGVMFEKP